MGESVDRGGIAAVIRSLMVLFPSQAETQRTYPTIFERERKVLCTREFIASCIQTSPHPCYACAMSHPIALPCTVCLKLLPIDAPLGYSFLASERQCLLRTVNIRLCLCKSFASTPVYFQVWQH
jgi:hypothetical protein